MESTARMMMRSDVYLDTYELLYVYTAGKRTPF